MDKVERKPAGARPKTSNPLSNIKVAVRVRPGNDRTKPIIVDVVDDKTIIFVRQLYCQGAYQPNTTKQNYLKRTNTDLKFVFDNVCGQSATNKDVFEITTKEMLGSLMEGYNCSVFTYGDSGAGKTFTMIGNSEDPGITHLTMEHLFYIMDTNIHSLTSFLLTEREFDIDVSYLEVYNENIYDLLNPSNTQLQLHEGLNYHVTVTGLKLFNIKTARELLQMLKVGNKKRCVHSTVANAKSSRSHAVFQVYIKMRYNTGEQQRNVKLSMIDLAGSERASAMSAVGDRFKEGANINKSLLSLWNCINRLADGDQYIPYRDSKLTRLLKDSLGGNCKTVMIANVSPTSCSSEDTYNTLQIAARANLIKLNIKATIVEGDMRLPQYVTIKEKLEKKVKDLEKKEKDWEKKGKDYEKTVNELRAKLTQSSLKVVQQHNSDNDKAKQEWRRRLLEENELHPTLQKKLLSLMSLQRALAQQHSFSMRAFSQVADLAHSSSTVAMEQMCTEDLTSQKRATNNYKKQSEKLDSEVIAVWSKWRESRNKFNNTCKQALSDCPEIDETVETIQLLNDLRHGSACDELKENKSIQNDDTKVFTECTSHVCLMLEESFLILERYDEAPPALTADYLEVTSKAKSDKEVEASQFKLSNTSQPSTSTEYSYLKKDDGNATADSSDSDDLIYVENRELARMAPKRKGTPIMLLNNEIIIINDSLESIDMTRNVGSAKKVKLEFDMGTDVENYGVSEPNKLNSTFLVAEKIKENKKPIKMEQIKKEPVKKGLADKTNTKSQRTTTFNSEKGTSLASGSEKAVKIKKVED